MRLRLTIGGLLLVSALFMVPRFGMPDFAQDYAAARGWWDGRDPNGKTPALLAECCPDLAQLYPDMQTAHPPFATLLALPLAPLPWTVARYGWLFISWVAIVGAWHLGQTRPSVCAVTASFWIIALVLGTHEPLLFVLLMAGLLIEPRQPVWAGVFIGLSAAIKIYPVLFLLGLWLAGKRQVAIVAAATGVIATLLTELILGLGVTLAWIAYVPENTQRYVDTIGNGSLMRLVRQLIPDASPGFVALIACLLLLLPLLPRLRRGDWLRPLLPVILLISPLSWRHYMGLVAIVPLGRIEQVCLALSGIVAILIGLDLIPPDNLAPIVQGPLLLVLLLLWYRMSRPERQSIPRQSQPKSGDKLSG